MDVNLYKLTEREKEIYELLVKGITRTEIAQQLYISRTTVDTHINSICVKKRIKGNGRMQKLVCDYYMKNMENIKSNLPLH